MPEFDGKSYRASGVRKFDPLVKLRYQKFLRETPEFQAMQHEVRDTFARQQRNPGATISNAQAQAHNTSSALSRRAQPANEKLGPSKTARPRPRGPAPDTPSRTPKIPRNRGGLLYGGKDVQFHDPASKRLGGLAGQPTQGKGNLSKGTFFSRYGNQKGFGRGPFGVSASRVRSAKEFTANPSTWFKRSLLLYVADEATRAYAEFNNFGDVSVYDTVDEANTRTGQSNAFESLVGGSKQLVKNFGGQLIGDVFVKPIMLAGKLGTGQLAMDTSDGAMARKFDLVDKVWAGEWEYGDLVEPQQFYQRHARKQRANFDAGLHSAAAAALDRYTGSVQDALIRMKDTLAFRGVGDIKSIKKAYLATAQSQSEKDKAIGAARREYQNEYERNKSSK